MTIPEIELKPDNNLDASINRWYHSHDGAHFNAYDEVVINGTLAGTIEENERGWVAIVNGDEYPCACWEQAETTIIEIYNEENNR